MISEAQLRRRLALREIEPKRLTMAEAAKIIGVSVPTMRRWRQLGFGPAPWRVGLRLLHYTEQEVLHYLERIADGDPKTTRHEQSWDPKTFRLLNEPEQPADPSSGVAESQAEAEAEAEIERYRKAGMLGDD
jgi:predicted DNA-binding transcriptional regulator AlpA